MNMCGLTDPNQTTIEDIAHIDKNWSTHEFEFIATYCVTGFKTKMLWGHLVSCSQVNNSKNTLKPHSLGSKCKTLTDLHLEAATQLLVCNKIFKFRKLY